MNRPPRPGPPLPHRGRQAVGALDARQVAPLERGVRPGRHIVQNTPEHAPLRQPWPGVQGHEQSGRRRTPLLAQVGEDGDRCVRAGCREATISAAVSIRTRGGSSWGCTISAKSCARLDRTPSGSSPRRVAATTTSTSSEGVSTTMPDARSAELAVSAQGSWRRVAAQARCSHVRGPVWSTYTPWKTRDHSRRRIIRSMCTSSSPAWTTCRRDTHPGLVEHAVPETTAERWQETRLLLLAATSACEGQAPGVRLWRISGTRCRRSSCPARDETPLWGGRRSTVGP